MQDNHIDFANDSDIIINYLIAMHGQTKAAKIAEIKKRADTFEIDTSLFEAYEKQAKKLAILEYEMGAKLLHSHQENDKNELQKLLFDILLTLKPYTFNQATIKEHKKRLTHNAKELS
jgi:hypothetical protein